MVHFNEAAKFPGSTFRVDHNGYAGDTYYIRPDGRVTRICDGTLWDVDQTELRNNPLGIWWGPSTK
jgi:hypothetical protein